MDAIDPNAFVGMGGIPLIQALTALVKTMWQRLPNKYIPGVSIAWGITLNIVLMQLTHVPYWQAVLVGVVAGLFASGLYRGAKAASND